MADWQFLLNRFPVEILHNIFDYLWCDEIIYSLFNQNEHLDEIIRQYSSHRWNFLLIQKSRFDHVCRIIPVDRVIFLRLSDDLVTPGQSKLFLSYFSLQQFIRLRSITLHQLEHDSLNLALTQLIELNELRSVSIFRTDTKDNSLLRIPSEVLLRLNRLTVGSALRFELSIPLENLRYLTVERWDIKYLGEILSKLPQLTFLDVDLEVGASKISDLRISSPLCCLKLKLASKSSFIRSFSYSIFEMFRFLDENERH